MPINDATRPAEPALLKTPDNLIEISRLPKRPAAASATLGRSAGATARDRSGRSVAFAGSTGWRSKHTPAKAGG
jgi:hypothetical protein